MTVAGRLSLIAVRHSGQSPQMRSRRYARFVGSSGYLRAVLKEGPHTCLPKAALESSHERTKNSAWTVPERSWMKSRSGQQV